MKYEYLCTQPDLPDERRPSRRNSPVMDGEEMTSWMNTMSTRGWEFVSYGQTLWSGGSTQEWWVFRKPAVTIKTGDALEDNVRYLLDKCPHTVRDLSGDRTGMRGREDLAGSLSITFLGMQKTIEELTKRGKP